MRLMSCKLGLLVGMFCSSGVSFAIELDSRGNAASQYQLVRREDSQPRSIATVASDVPLMMAKQTIQRRFWAGEVDKLEGKMPSVSIVVPSIPQRVANLEKVVKSFVECQTSMPDEIVLAISGMRKSKENIQQALERIKGYLNQFSIRYVESFAQEDEYAGGNRNRGAQAASSEIIAFSDDDDIMHPQKVEIIRWLFSIKPDLDFVLTSYVPHDDWKRVIKTEPFCNYGNFSAIPATSKLGTIAGHMVIPEDITWNKDLYRVSPVFHAGSVLRQRIKKQFSFSTSGSRGEDGQFDQAVVNTLAEKQVLFLDAKLYVYELAREKQDSAIPDSTQVYKLYYAKDLPACNPSDPAIFSAAQHSA